MATNIEVTGPVGVFFDVGDGPDLLGTAEVRPRFLFRRIFEPVYNDVGGSIPFDMQYMGSDALIIMDINKINYSLLEALQSLPSMDVDNWGSEPFGSIGSLMIQEELAADCFLVFPYGSGGPAEKPGTQLPNGIHFLNAWLLGPDDHQAGTVHEKVRIIVQCLRDYDETTGDFTLFDQEIPALNVR